MIPPRTLVAVTAVSLALWALIVAAVVALL